MHAVDARSGHEDLAIGPGLRQIVDRGADDLEGDVRLEAVILRALIIVRAHHREDEIEKAPQDAIFVKAFNGFKQLFDARDGGVEFFKARFLFGGACRIEAGVKSGDERARDRRVL